MLKPNRWHSCQTFRVLNITRLPQNCILGRSDKPLRFCEHENIFIHIYHVFARISWSVLMSFISSAQWHVVMGPSRGRLCATPGTTPSACVWTASLTPSESVAWIHVPVSSPSMHSLPGQTVLCQSRHLFNCPNMSGWILGQSKTWYTAQKSRTSRILFDRMAQL